MENTALINITDEFCNELKNRNYPYTRTAVETIIDEWYKAKKPLIDLLSKHPNWNSEKFMIQFDSDFSRKPDTSTARDFLNWLNRNTNIQDIVTEGTSWSFRRTLFDDIGHCMVHTTYLQEEDTFCIKLINNLDESFRFRPGMKVTKVMRKICEHYGWTKIMGTEYNRHGEQVEFNAFEREYAKYCDAMSPLKVTRHTCISLNPLDYLLMSNGNSWRSCHYIDYFDDHPGEYSSGTISYMLDETSIVFYTVNASYDGDNIELTEKTQRQIFGYNDCQIMQSRMYPQNNDYNAENIYEDFRNIMQKVIADCLEKPNLWVRRKKHLNVVHGNGATCYPDWEYNDLCSTSVLKEKSGLDLVSIVLGATPICVECGKTHNKVGNINCCRDGYCCEDCGRYISEDDVIWVGDYPYCRDCVSWCDCCQEWTRDEMYYIKSEDRSVCEYCLNEYYVYCAHCYTYHNMDETFYDEDRGEYFCPDCFEELYTECENCGQIVRRKDLNEVHKANGDVVFICDECYAEEDEDNE